MRGGGLLKQHADLIELVLDSDDSGKRLGNVRHIYRICESINNEEMDLDR